MNKFPIWAVLISAGILTSGCQSITRVGVEARPIFLKEAQTLPAIVDFLHTVHLPSGTYQPAFQTDLGVYYRTESAIRFEGNSMSATWTGGLFLPKANTKDQRQGVWFDLKDNSKTRLVRINNPARYEVLESNTNAPGVN